MKKKTGLFGGTFDPIHRGHVQVAELSLTRAGLDEVWFIPSKQPPHKYGVQASFAHRVAMVERAILDKERMCCSTIEKMYTGPSYTLRTVELFDRQYGKNREPYLIIGADSFLDLESWYTYEKLFEKAHLVVVGRPGVANGAVENKAAEFGFSKREKDTFINKVKKRLICIYEKPENISSTSIRKMLCENKNISEYINSKVVEYISYNNLYVCD